MTSTCANPTATAATDSDWLERLGDAFDAAAYSTVLTTDEVGRAVLTVTSRHCPLSEDLYADSRYFRFSWGEPAGPVDDPQAAAARVARMLRPLEPSRG